ncbi:hypothetical protein SLS57_006857 [Botryosphaeria dothidea]
MMRLCSQQQAAAPNITIIRQVPRSEADLLAARLSSLLARNGHGGAASNNDLALVAGPSICFFPQRLGQSAALSDATACFLGAHHAALLQRRDPDAFIDPRGYWRALRSLQLAINDPRERYSANTLAATALLQRMEETFGAIGHTDFGLTHAGGLIAFMNGRGFSQASDDEFETQLFTEACWHIVQFSIFSEKEQLTAHEKWVGVLESAVVKDEMSLFHQRLGLLMLRWPALIGYLRRIREGAPEAPPPQQHLRAALQAAHELRAYDADVIAVLKRRGDVRETVDEQTGVPRAYEFSGHQVAWLFAHHAMVSIVVNRVLQQLAALCNTAPRRAWEREMQDWGRRVWLTYAFARRFHRLQCAYLLTPLVVSIVVAEPRQRAGVVQAVCDTQSYRQGEHTRAIFSAHGLWYTSRMLCGQLPILSGSAGTYLNEATERMFLSKR